MAEELCKKNTDIELWRQNPNDYYSPSIHVTKQGLIGMNVGGFVIVADIRHWYKWADRAIKQSQAINQGDDMDG